MNAYLTSIAGNISPLIPTGPGGLQEARLVTTKSLRALKLGTWAYFFLLIFEGTLRKWFLPGLATPLLIIREPLAIWLLLTLARRRDLFPVNGYIIIMAIIAVVGMTTAVLLGHGNLLVAMFGARILLIDFPLLFVIGRIFTRSDVVEVGRVTLWITIPMAVLNALQFYSPQSAWVNRGVGGNVEGAGFSGAMDFFRPPGTFSFTSGNTLFFGLAACFIIYFWLNSKQVNRLLLAGATVALLAAVPLTISRTLVFHIGISVLFAVVAVVIKPSYAKQMFLIIAGSLMVVVLLSQTRFFQTATLAFTTRFQEATEHEGGFGGGTVGNRFLGGLIGSVTNLSELPFFGRGLGMGTNVGSMLLAGDRTFLIAEEEWERVIGELGLFMGFTVILLRLVLTVTITLDCYRKLRGGDLLPWMLLSYGFLLLLQGGWSQPTSLGFYTLIGGLLLATLQNEQAPASFGERGYSKPKTQRFV